MNETMIISGVEISIDHLMQIVEKCVGAILASKGRINRLDKEDICSEVLYDIWRSRDTYNPKKASLTTWVNTIARNCIINAFKKKVKSPELVNVNEEINTDDRLAFLNAKSESESESYDDCYNIIRNAIDFIPNQGRRRVLELELDGYKTHEMATRLNRTPNAISALLNRAHSDLKDVLRSKFSYSA